MLTTREAMEKRRSIRKFKPAPIADDILKSLLESARLAPSGCNAQPWRFKIIKDGATKMKLARAAHDQSFIADAPVVLVCCADIRGYLEGTVSSIQDLERTGVIEEQVAETILKRTEAMAAMPVSQLAPRIAFNVAIAVEHIVLRALDFGLGSCWIRLFDEQAIRDIFGWDENIHVVNLLPIGYPAEEPRPRNRRPLEDILL